MIEAFVLITVEVGKVKNVINSLTNLEGVKTVKAVTGPYDVIAEVKAEDLSMLTKTIVEGIHSIEGVIDTTTAIIVEL